MKVNIEIDEKCKETLVIIRTKEMNDDIRKLSKHISLHREHYIQGFQEERIKILEEENIYRIYSECGKIYAETQDGIYQIKQRLYEVENTLDDTCFVRISHAEIININKVKHFDVSLAGTVKVTMQHGVETFVSRRNITKINQILGKRGK